MGCSISKSRVVETQTGEVGSQLGAARLMPQIMKLQAVLLCLATLHIYGSQSMDDCMIAIISMPCLQRRRI